MGNHYTYFSEEISNLTDEEEAWIRKTPRKPDLVDKVGGEDLFRAALDDYGIQLYDNHYHDLFPHFDSFVQEGSWCIRTSDWADLDHVSALVQAFIKKFRPDSVFRLTYAETDDNVEVGKSGGGWVVVSKDEIVYGNTWDAAKQALED